MRDKNPARAFWKIVQIGSFLLLGTLTVSGVGLGKEDAFKIAGKTYTIDEIRAEDQGKFFEIDKKKYELIEDIARRKYLDHYFSGIASKKGISVEKARQDYLDKNAGVSESDTRNALKRFADNPRLKKLSEKERRKQITDYLSSVKKRDAIDRIINEARRSKKLTLLVPRPREPLFDVKVTKDDSVKYGPGSADTKPIGCAGDACPITVVEYSEYQCPFCVRVLPAVNRLMTEYKGRVRWIVRDFPLGFHDRARPAAVAAQCAKKQGKFWQMYETLFKNQRKLADKDLRSYGKTIRLDQKKYEKCLDNPGGVMATINRNYQSGEKLGVSGTPAFFINGRRLSGALPFEEFKKIFDEELAAADGKKKS